MRRRWERRRIGIDGYVEVEREETVVGRGRRKGRNK